MAEDVAADKPVVVTKFILDAKDIEFDSVANKGTILKIVPPESTLRMLEFTMVLSPYIIYIRNIHIKIQRPGSRMSTRSLGSGINLGSSISSMNVSLKRERDLLGKMVNERDE